LVFRRGGGRFFRGKYVKIAGGRKKKGGKKIAA